MKHFVLQLDISDQDKQEITHQPRKQQTIQKTKKEKEIKKEQIEYINKTEVEKLLQTQIEFNLDTDSKLFSLDQQIHFDRFKYSNTPFQPAPKDPFQKIESIQKIEELRKQHEEKLERLERLYFQQNQQPSQPDFKEFKVETKSFLMEDEVQKIKSSLDASCKYKKYKEKKQQTFENEQNYQFQQQQEFHEQLQFEIPVEKLKKRQQSQIINDQFLKMLQEAKQVKDKKSKKVNDFLMKYIFTQIDQEATCLVSKKETFQYISKNIILAFDLQPKTLQQEIQVFKTKREDIFDFQEFLKFMSIPRKRVTEESNIIQKMEENFNENQEQNNSTQQNLYQNQSESESDQEPQEQQQQDVELISAVTDIFSIVDVQQEGIVLFQDLMSHLEKESYIQENINKVIIKIEKLQSEISLFQIVQKLKFDFDFNDKNKQYISMTQFKEYFINHKLYLNLDYEIKDSITIKQENLQIIQDIFDIQPRIEENFIKFRLFLSQLKTDIQIRDIRNEPARKFFVNHTEHKEKISDFIKRMETFEIKYIQWNDILGFLSEKGEPLNKLNQPMIEKMKEKEKQEIKGEQIMNDFQKIKMNDPSKTQTKLQQLEELDNYINSYSPEKRHKLIEIEEKIKKFTVPEPFKCAQKEKKMTIQQQKVIQQYKLQEMIQNKEKDLQQHLQYQFKSKEIPEAVKMPQYEALRQKELKKKQEKANRKKYLEQKKQQKIVIEQDFQPNYQKSYKAKPVPEYVYEDMNEKVIRPKVFTKDQKLPGQMEQRDYQRKKLAEQKLRQVLLLAQKQIDIEQQKLEEEKKNINAQERLQIAKKAFEEKGKLEKEKIQQFQIQKQKKQEKQNTRSRNKSFDNKDYKQYLTNYYQEENKNHKSQDKAQNFENNNTSLKQKKEYFTKSNHLYIENRKKHQEEEGKKRDQAEKEEKERLQRIKDRTPVVNQQFPKPPKHNNSKKINQHKQQFIAQTQNYFQQVSQMKGELDEKKAMATQKLYGSKLLEKYRNIAYNFSDDSSSGKQDDDMIENQAVFSNNYDSVYNKKPNEKILKIEETSNISFQDQMKSFNPSPRMDQMFSSDLIPRTEQFENQLKEFAQLQSENYGDNIDDAKNYILKQQLP